MGNIFNLDCFKDDPYVYVYNTTNINGCQTISKKQIRCSQVKPSDTLTRIWKPTYKGEFDYEIRQDKHNNDIYLYWRIKNFKYQIVNDDDYAYSYF